MSNFKQYALKLLELRDFVALRRHLEKASNDERQLADEIYLLSLIKQDISSSALEHPFDN